MAGLILMATTWKLGTLWSIAWHKSCTMPTSFTFLVFIAHRSPFAQIDSFLSSSRAFRVIRNMIKAERIRCTKQTLTQAEMHSLRIIANNHNKLQCLHQTSLHLCLMEIVLCTQKKSMKKILKARMILKAVWSGLNKPWGQAEKNSSPAHRGRTDW